jgi:hypothetical protein
MVIESKCYKVDPESELGRLLDEETSSILLAHFLIHEIPR